MKKFIGSILSIIWVWMWFVCAQSISFVSQWGSIFWYDCTVPIDVYISTNWQEISAIDLVLESSMNYVDFVPSDFVPYYLKPIVKENGLIHVVWFTVDPSERINWDWKMWTIYLKPKQWDIDGVVRLYFLWEWETSDTNLSIAWWVDVLKDVWQISVKFSKDLPSCVIGSESVASDGYSQVEKIDWWFADLTYDEVLENTIKSIDKKHWSTSAFWQILRHSIVWIILILILLIIILLLLRKEKSKWNKNVVKQ